MNPPIAASYLVEASYDGKGSLRVLDAARLADYLRRVIWREYHTGDADAVHGLYRYDGPGELTELILVQVGEEGLGGDCLERRYRLLDKTASEGPADGKNSHVSFAVRIDSHTRPARRRTRNAGNRTPAPASRQGQR